MEIFGKVNAQYTKKLPFAVFCKPGSDKVAGIFQNDDSLHVVNDFTEKGFVFVPFDGDGKCYIPYGKSGIHVEKMAAVASGAAAQNHPAVDEAVKAKFEALVKKGVAAICNGDFKKVVLSRVERLEVTGLNPVEVIKQLIVNYPAAFTYCFFHPKIGMWFGATPEQLLQADGKNIKTVALAGTQLFSEHMDWGEKEKQEQQFVTDFIHDSLRDHCSEISVSEPYTAKAGSIAHIKTDLRAVLNDSDDLGSLIRLLHPTPAVCGLPKEEARQFIIGNEGYDRKFYTGFLGELNIDLETSGEGRSDLFVNLRCMEIEGNKAHIYVGCGITKDSDPEKEYIETVNKTMTMRKVLNLQD